MKKRRIFQPFKAPVFPTYAALKAEHDVQSDECKAPEVINDRLLFWRTLSERLGVENEEMKRSRLNLELDNFVLRKKFHIALRQLDDVVSQRDYVLDQLTGVAAELYKLKTK